MLLVVKQQSMQLVLPVLGDNMAGVHKQIITHFPLAHGQKSLHNPVIFTFSLWLPFFDMCCVICGFNKLCCGSNIWTLKKGLV